MKLLDAVNLVLPKLGERPVTSLEARRPTLAVLLPILENTRRTVLNRGWWFNDYDYTAPLNVDNEVTLGTDTLSFVPTCGVGVLRGLRLWNQKDGNYKFSAPVAGRLTVDVPFDDLPESAAQYVWNTSLVTAHTTDIGMNQDTQVWATAAQQGYSDMLAEHLRNKRYNTRQRRSWQRLQRALRS